MEREGEKEGLFMQHVSKSQQGCTNTPGKMVRREGNMQSLVLGEPRLSIKLTRREAL